MVENESSSSMCNENFPENASVLENVGVGGSESLDLGSSLYSQDLNQVSDIETTTSHECNDEPISKRNYMKIPNLVKAGMRLGLSHNEVAMLGSSAAVDLGIVTPEDRTYVIDRNKVSRVLYKL